VHVLHKFKTSVSSLDLASLGYLCGLDDLGRLGGLPTYLPRCLST
jgi:hypothetical protein